VKSPNSEQLSAKVSSAAGLGGSFALGGEVAVLFCSRKSSITSFFLVASAASGAASSALLRNEELQDGAQ